MKSLLILPFMFFTFYSFADVWEPHEKELVALLWKAERTPEMKLKKNFKIETMKISRSFVDCSHTDFQGVTKFTTRRPFSSQ